MKDTTVKTLNESQKTGAQLLDEAEESLRLVLAERRLRRLTPAETTAMKPSEVAAYELDQLFIGDYMSLRLRFISDINSLRAQGMSRADAFSYWKLRLINNPDITIFFDVLAALYGGDKP